jgi:hypothetical protein
MPLQHVVQSVGPRQGRDYLLEWAQCSGHRPTALHRRGVMRFAFYGRVSTEDWQDPEDTWGRLVKRSGLAGELDLHT